MITQPDNTTACVGGTIMFTCVIDTSNVNISTEDISWWRKPRDYNNNLLPDAKISQHGTRKFKTTYSNTGGKLTSALTIANVKLSDTGPYWLRLMDTENTMNSNIAFLSIIPTGMYNCVVHTWIYPCSYIHMYTLLVWYLLTAFKVLIKCNKMLIKYKHNKV